MGLFSVEYRNVPGQCIYARGGLKFRADEDALYQYFEPILHNVTLNDLIGEAVFWSMLPSTIALWTFPFLLLCKGAIFALITTIIIYLILEIGHLSIYIKPLNYIIFILGNNVLAFIVYIIWAVIFIITGAKGQIIILGAWFLFFAVGLNKLIILFPFIPILTKIFSLPPSDQILRNIGWNYARKYGIDPSKWKMRDREIDNTE